MDTELLGVVTDGRFVPLAPDTAPAGAVRLTRIGMQEARTPDSGEIDLGPAEGRAILVRGRLSGGWLYSTTIISRGGPILSTVVRELFKRRRA